MSDVADSQAKVEIKDAKVVPEQEKKNRHRDKSASKRPRFCHSDCGVCSADDVGTANATCCRDMDLDCSKLDWKAIIEPSAADVDRILNNKHVFKKDAPDSFEHASSKQRRLILYRLVWLAFGLARDGTDRVKLPSCARKRVGEAYPDIDE